MKPAYRTATIKETYRQDREYRLNGVGSYDRPTIDDIAWQTGERIQVAVHIPAYAYLTPVTASFGQPVYHSAEEGQKAVVEVRLDQAPGRTVTIPLVTENLGGARDADHEGIPASVTFGAEETVKTFEVTAIPDDSWEESESERVAISFGEIPGGVRAGQQDTADVFLVDRFVTVWVEFPDGRWVSEDAGTLNATLVGRTRQHHRATDELVAHIPIVADDGTQPKLTGRFQAADDGADEDYVRYSTTLEYGVWIYDEQCQCSMFRINISITINDDDDAEPTEEFVIIPSTNGQPDWIFRADDPAYAVGDNNYHAFILDNDNPDPIISIEPLDADITEGEVIAIRITADKPTTHNTDVRLVFRETGDTLVADGSIRYTMPLGATRHVVYASTVNDAVREDSSLVEVSIHHNRNDENQQYQIGPGHTATVQVRDNEMPVQTAGAPQRARATAGNRRITVSWDAPLQMGDARLLRYDINTYTSTATTSTNVGTQTSRTFTNLDNGTLYIFRIRAVTSSGAGAWSAGVSATPLSLQDPAIPRGLAGDGYDGRVLLAWGDPAHNGGSAIGRYEYRYGPTSETEETEYGPWQSTRSAEAGFTVQGLTNGQPYDFQVRAVNSAGRAGRIAGVRKITPQRYVQPLTVAVENLPADHGGRKFTLTLRFDHLLLTSPETIEQGAPTPIGSGEFDRNDRTPFIQVTGGMITEIAYEADYVKIPSGLSEEEGLWRWFSQDALHHVTIMPGSHDPVTVSVQAGSIGHPCNEVAHICNHYDDHLSNSIEHTIEGPRQLTVSDAGAREGTDFTMTFTVRLSEPSAGEVTVRWQTQDRTALSTSDYEADSGTLTFAPGETVKTITIGVRDDGSAEGAQEFRLVLVDATGAAISDGVGVGTINDDD